jgi:hypothetical protein
MVSKQEAIGIIIGLAQQIEQGDIHYSRKTLFTEEGKEFTINVIEEEEKYCSKCEDTCDTCDDCCEFIEDCVCEDDEKFCDESYEVYDDCECDNTNKEDVCCSSGGHEMVSPPLMNAFDRGRWLKSNKGNNNV